MTDLHVEDWGLREEASRYHDLFEFAPVGFVLTDAAGSIVEVNPTAGELLGVPPFRLVGKPMTIFVPVANRRQFRRTLLGLAHTATEAEWELDLETRDRGRLHVQLNASRSPSGQLRWMIQDVTERVATEHRLRTLASALEERVLERTDELEQERARLASIVDQMPGGLVVVDAPSRRVLTVNEQAHELLGTIDEIPAFDDDSPLGRALDGSTVVSERVEYVKPSGSRCVLSVSAAPVRDRAGRIAAAVSIFEEVTQREARDRAEREFVTNAAHELQSPIAAITSAVEVLQAGAKDTPDRDLFIEHIERQSQRLVRLTTALLTLSRAETDVEEPRTEVVDLYAMLSAIADRAEPAEDVSLTVDCPHELALVANRELLGQVISNVVRNAEKYTDDGSIRIEAELHEGGVEIRVVDTGIGISREALPRVAERFYRGETSKDGFGLGLSIVQAALDVMGGALRVASPGLGQGTTVTMSLPHGATQVAR
ncbi:MAG TPA: ATP-binding protein [Gaiellaceae bacterium]|nr:ATP-binding protein [Gaiellaceae bacterium]